jgi:hypothetical protein
MHRNSMICCSSRNTPSAPVQPRGQLWRQTEVCADGQVSDESRASHANGSRWRALFSVTTPPQGANNSCPATITRSRAGVRDDVQAVCADVMWEFAEVVAVMGLRQARIVYRCLAGLNCSSKWKLSAMAPHRRRVRRPSQISCCQMLFDLVLQASACNKTGRVDLGEVEGFPWQSLKAGRRHSQP